MGKLNRPPACRRYGDNLRTLPTTHEGGIAFGDMTPEQALRRSVMSCLLWEDEFYEDGQSVASRIASAARQVPAQKLAEIAVEARTQFNLRHVPLQLLAVLAQTGRGSRLVQDTIAQTIERADELTEFLAVYAKLNGVAPNALKPKLSNQVRKGVARAFLKFDEYQLAKYDRAGPIRLQHVIDLCHCKPHDVTRRGKTVTAEEINALWGRLANDELKTPDTWEVSLSRGADKRETFERLLKEGKLGYLALLRNLRNMEQAGVDKGLVTDAIKARKGANRVLPFRYVAAARAAPTFESALDTALLASIAEAPPLRGRTGVLVDISGSMNQRVSGKSDLQRMDAAATLASIVNAEALRVWTFSNDIVEIDARRGLKGIKRIIESQSHGGTNLAHALRKLPSNLDRVIVITDEQSHDDVTHNPGWARSFMINVGSYQHGVGYGKWVHIDGFSEQVLRFIYEMEGTRLISSAPEDYLTDGPLARSASMLHRAESDRFDAIGKPTG